MKTILTAILAIFSPVLVFCQDITGLWTGTMSDDKAAQPQSYEVYISKEKGKYTGYSKTWYVIDGKECTGIKKIKVDIAKDGKIILLDQAWLENDHPYADKDFKQLGVLDLANTNTESTLNGLFFTRIRRYNDGSGKIQLKKADTFSESTLMRYLQKTNGDGDVTAVK